MVGRQISRYRIVEQIGSGGMSVVYKGVDGSLDREVAVKVLHPHLASKAESRRRFSREAKAVARLHHPNILEIYDFSGDDAEESFIVTEYIRGTTLKGFADADRFDPPEIAAMAVHELASALEHAHGFGVIHRDLKPENVMIRADGVLKLMDFGIAKVLDRDERMTMTGALVGSPAHMAPEIIEGVEAGREADIFSLGTILYWLCCQKLPFIGNNTTQTLKLILDCVYPDPRIANAAVSDALAQTIARCLAREPKDRYPSAEGLKEALARALLDSGIERPGEELASFFADPPGYRQRLKGRLVQRLTETAEAAVAARKEARALDCLNRVLALDPASARATELIEAMKRRRKRARRLSAAAAILAGAAGVSSGGYALTGLFSQVSPEVNSVEAPDHPPRTVVSEVPPATREPVDRAPPSVAIPVEAPTKEKGPDPPGEGPVPPLDVRPAAFFPPGTRKLAPSGASSRKETGKGEVKVAKAQLGSLSIRVSPYVPILLDGVWVNQERPMFEDRVPVGRHTIRVDDKCCLPYEEVITVGAEGTLNKVIQPEPKPALLTVESTQELSIMVDAVYMKTSSVSVKDPIPVSVPRATFRRTATLRLFGEGLKDREISQVFEAGKATRLKVELDRP